jgi:hypothetical protein
MVKGRAKEHNEMGVLWNGEKLLSRLRTTKIDRRLMVFTVLLGIEWDWKRPNEMNEPHVSP